MTADPRLLDRLRSPLGNFDHPHEANQRRAQALCTEAADTIERLQRELWVIAECIFQNVSSDDAKHWARGIKVSLQSGDAAPRVTVETTGVNPLNKRVHVACKDNVSSWEYPHLVICFSSIADLHAAALYLSLSPVEPPEQQTVDRLVSERLARGVSRPMQFEKASGLKTETVQNECTHDFRPIDSSGQFACIYCNQRQVKATETPSTEWCMHLTTYDDCPYGCTPENGKDEQT